MLAVSTAPGTETTRSMAGRATEHGGQRLGGFEELGGLDGLGSGIDRHFVERHLHRVDVGGTFGNHDVRHVVGVETFDRSFVEVVLYLVYSRSLSYEGQGGFKLSAVSLETVTNPTNRPPDGWQAHF